MKKILIIVAHPHIEKSVVNKRWIEELKQYPKQFTVHELYKTYPDGVINIEKEQALIEEHSSLILQFPIYWFNCTPLLKQWLDDVFTDGWAYGSTGDKLKNKKVGLAVSAGSVEESYTQPFITLQETLQPFEMTMNYVNADYQGVFVLYGANTDPEKASVTPELIQQSAQDYVQFLSRF